MRAKTRFPFYIVLSFVTTWSATAAARFSEHGRKTISTPGMVAFTNYGYADSLGSVIFSSSYFGGGASKSVFWRADAEGERDKTFGTGGEIQFKAPGMRFFGATGHGQQKSGDTIVAGIGFFEDTDTTLFRLSKEGTTDKTFGEGGVARVDLPGGLGDNARKLVIDADDRIWVFSTSFVDQGEDLGSIARFLPNGRSDLSFQNLGVQTLSFAEGQAVDALYHDGYVYFLGRSNVDAKSRVSYYVSRIDGKGELDTRYGTAGRAELLSAPTPLLSTLSHLAVDSAGRILVAGTLLVGGDTDLVVYRMQKNGSLDKTFANEGAAQIDIRLGSDDQPQFLKVDSTGNIVVAGACIYRIDNKTDPRVPVNRFLGAPADSFLLRLTPHGELDASFGIDGVAVHHLNDFQPLYARWLLGMDGKMFSYWNGMGMGGPTAGIRAVRFRTNGFLD